MIRFETTLGDFTIELFEKEAPVTVVNFLHTSTTASSTARFFTASFPGS